MSLPNNDIRIPITYARVVTGIFGWPSGLDLGGPGQNIPFFLDSNQPLSTRLEDDLQGSDSFQPLPLFIKPPEANPPPGVSSSTLSVKLHPAVLQSRRLLLSIYPNPLPSVYPNPLPIPLPQLSTYNLTPQQQLCLLIGLTHLSSPKEIAYYRSQQIKSLPKADGKLLTDYQTAPGADPRLALFPIAILRSRLISVCRGDFSNTAHHRPPRRFDLTMFLTDVLSSVTIYANPNDTDAWDLPHSFWDRWEDWFPQGREYCKSLRDWRMRDGHTGSGVVEMLLGIESEGSRRQGPVGKPQGWKFG